METITKMTVDDPETGEMIGIILTSATGEVVISRSADGGWGMRKKEGDSLGALQGVFYTSTAAELAGRVLLGM
jgi:hypothetical protein